MFEEQIGSFNGKVENEFAFESMDLDHQASSHENHIPIEVQRHSQLFTPVTPARIDNYPHPYTPGIQQLEQINNQTVSAEDHGNNSHVNSLPGPEHNNPDNAPTMTTLAILETQEDTLMVDLSGSSGNSTPTKSEAVVNAKEAIIALEKKGTSDQSEPKDDKALSTSKEVNPRATEIKVWIDGVDGFILLADPLCSALPFFFYNIGMHVEMVSSSRLWGRPRNSPSSEFACISTDADLAVLLSQSRDVSIVIGTRVCLFHI